MGVYIRGMEMPTSCRDCFVNIVTSAFPACHLAKNYTAGKTLVAEGLGNNIRPDGCPLVDIPPHGDLIDRDVLEKYKELVTAAIPGGKLTREYVPMAAVRNVKAILEAEEGET